MNARTMMTAAVAAVVALSVRAGVVDLGVVDAHQKVECGFAITNSSSSSWYVQGARSSCACMAVEVRRGELKAGEVLPVKVVFDPQGMEGAVAKSVQVDLKSRPPIVRDYRAQVRLRLGLKPSDAAFGVIRSSDANRTITASLTGYAASNAVITAIIPPANAIFEVTSGHAGRVTVPVGCVTVPDAAVDVVGSRVPRDRLTVRFANLKPLPGTYAETWRIRTNDPEIPEIAFPVSARIADGFSVTPHVLTISAGLTAAVGDPRAPRTVGSARCADRDETSALVRSRVSRDRLPRTVSRTVTLRRDDQKPFKVLSAETKPRKWGDVRIVPRPLNGWAVVIENIDPAAVRQFSKRPFLEINTSLPGTESLKVPLRVEK